jgi:hypothetical protein
MMVLSSENRDGLVVTGCLGEGLEATGNDTSSPVMFVETRRPLHGRSANYLQMQYNHHRSFHVGAWGVGLEAESVLKEHVLQLNLLTTHFPDVVKGLNDCRVKDVA